MKLNAPKFEVESATEDKLTRLRTLKLETLDGEDLGETGLPKYASDVKRHLKEQEATKAAEEPGALAPAAVGFSTPQVPATKNGLAHLEKFKFEIKTKATPTPGEREPTTLADDLFEFENLEASSASSHCISQANSS